MATKDDKKSSKKKKKDDGHISFRPSKKNAWICSKLEEYAAKENRSVNNYLETILLQIVLQKEEQQ